MKAPAFSRRIAAQRRSERGVTMVLVAASMVTILAMAAISIDVVTLYLANTEAQRSADTAALAAARVISISGITGAATPAMQPTYWQSICGATGAATQTAQAVAAQNTVGGISVAPASVTVTYSVPGGAPAADCSTLAAAFGINPLVTVKVQRTNLPTFFSRIWGRTGSSVSATATAEVFNSSNSGSVTGADLIPVQPRCVKPMIIPNLDPGNCSPSLSSACQPFIDVTNGSIKNPGITLGAGLGTNGVVGENFNLFADCITGAGTCNPPTTLQPIPNSTSNPFPPTLPYLPYVPGELPASVTAAPLCATSDMYQEAVAGCDQSTLYQCGTQLGNRLDLTRNPSGPLGDTATALQCVTTNGTNANPDTIDTTAYPFQIKAGASDALGITTSTISSSNSIVTIPIYEATPLTAGPAPAVTIVGFLQVFVNQVNPDNVASVNVTVLNVVGCGDGLTTTVGSPISGSSPVPVRLITLP